MLSALAIVASFVTFQTLPSWKSSKAFFLCFENIFFFGDGETDIPMYSVTNKSNGKSICVYEKNNEKSETIARKLLAESRVQYLVENDYSDGSDSDKLIKNYILSYKS